MRILVVEPHKAPRMREIDGELKTMQDIVGGTIQAIYPFEDTAALICNDDGKLLKLPPNRALYDENGALYDIVVGTFFLCDAPPDAESFTSLTDEQINVYMKRFAAPELFIRLGNQVLVLKEETP